MDTFFFGVIQPQSFLVEHWPRARPAHAEAVFFFAGELRLAALEAGAFFGVVFFGAALAFLVVGLVVDFLAVVFFAVLFGAFAFLVAGAAAFWANTGVAPAMATAITASESVMFRMNSIVQFSQ